MTRPRLSVAPRNHILEYSIRPPRRSALELGLARKYSQREAPGSSFPPGKDAKMPVARLRSNRLLLISLAITLGVLAITGGRIYRGIEALINPAPASLIIVAPATSDIV